MGHHCIILRRRRRRTVIVRLLGLRHIRTTIALICFALRNQNVDITHMRGALSFIASSTATRGALLFFNESVHEISMHENSPQHGQIPWCGFGFSCLRSGVFCPERIFLHAPNTLVDLKIDTTITHTTQRHKSGRNIYITCGGTGSIHFRLPNRLGFNLLNQKAICPKHR